MRWEKWLFQLKRTLKKKKANVSENKTRPKLLGTENRYKIGLALSPKSTDDCNDEGIHKSELIYRIGKGLFIHQLLVLIFIAIRHIIRSLNVHCNDCRWKLHIYAAQLSSCSKESFVPDKHLTGLKVDQKLKVKLSQGKNHSHTDRKSKVLHNFFISYLTIRSKISCWLKTLQYRL